MSNICLITLVGIPAAGKTTFCKNFHKWINPDEYIIKIYHFDEVLNNSNYHASRINIFNTIKDCIKEFYVAKIQIPIIILLDDNMMYKSMRTKYLQLASEYEISFGSIYFEITLELAKIRNSQRTDKVPIEIITKIDKVLEIPKDAFVIRSDDVFNDTLFEMFLKCIKNALNKPFKHMPPPVQVIHADKMSMKHKVDLVLRNIVSEGIKEKRTFSDLQIVKNEVYTNYKKGNIVVDSNWNETELRNFLKKYFN